MLYSAYYLPVFLSKTEVNKLFFGGEDTIDLSQIYGQKSRNKEKVRGIINIFNDYKFTIDENTPIDEEIALDPELLGKVFENLLAEYNPETESTARKQTGSFYTPREIVNYMVDESIIAYLKNQLLEDNNGFVEVGSNQINFIGNKYTQGQLTIQGKVDNNPFIGKEDELESKLRDLLSFSEVNPFTPDTQTKIITAIDNLKILDPACGSGAFPMGILQKLVHILSKLDPHNEQWRNQQKERAIAPLLADITQAQKISYEEARDKAIAQLQTRLQQIEDEFNHNEQDYPRKLFLIENCVYGVDIQPIAVQISKLRFFISLIVEQKVNDNRPNRGILPLPNLETKFVSANTLIGIDTQNTLRSPEVYQKEAELKQVRHNYFSANNPQDKQRCKELDQQLRTEITTLLKNTGLQGAIADTLARWNPYDQNVSSDFFDREWMFGFDREWMFGVKGFDIVIGNPPYVRMEKIKEIKPTLQLQYESYTGRADLYVYFYEQGLKLLRENGYLTYITSNKWLTTNYGENLRKYLAIKSQIHRIIDFGELPVFVAATFPMIFITQKQRTDKQSFVFTQVKSLDPPYPDIYALVKKQGQNLPETAIKGDNWTLTDNKVASFITKLESQLITLNDYVNGQIYWGIKTGLNEAFIIDQETRDKLINEYPASEPVIKKLIVGNDVRKWRINYQQKYLIYLPHGININNYSSVINHLERYKERLEKRATKQAWYELQQPQLNYVKYLENTKIIFPDIAKEPRFCLDIESIYVEATAFFIPTNNLYLLGILNTSIVWFYLTSICSVLGDPNKGGRLRLKRQYISQIPIPKATEAEKEAIASLVQKCLDAKGINCEQWEAEIDDRVAHLYGLTAEEMKIIRGE